MLRDRSCWHQLQLYKLLSRLQDISIFRLLRSSSNALLAVTVLTAPFYSLLPAWIHLFLDIFLKHFLMDFFQRYFLLYFFLPGRGINCNKFFVCFPSCRAEQRWYTPLCRSQSDDRINYTSPWPNYVLAPSFRRFDAEKVPPK